MDGAGNLYGTAQNGGANGDGTVFEIGAAGTETVLHSFAGGTPDGANPISGLIMDGAGDLYGTTPNGGADGQGIIFKISAAGTYSVLYSFGGAPADGAQPQGSLIMDNAGNIYGTTEGGGASGQGTVFKMSATGTETLLYSFTGTGTNAESPLAGVVMDSAGNFYGTTVLGGAHSEGTVFELSAAGTETLLYSFSGTPDAQTPGAGLVMDSAGNLYGTSCHGGASGDGAVFEVSAAGAENVLFSFGPPVGAQSGGCPVAGLVVDSAGNLYGTSTGGGAYGYGSVFEVSAAGTETVLYSFGTETGGQDPLAGDPDSPLLMDSAGNLYGTIPSGGANHDGAVFRIN